MKIQEEFLQRFYATILLLCSFFPSYKKAWAEKRRVFCMPRIVENVFSRARGEKEEEGSVFDGE